MSEERFRAVPTLAKRFLLSKSSDGFLSLIAWVSVVGVALGVLALTVVTSVINGFDGEIAGAIHGLNGDLVLYSRGDPVTDPDQIEAKVRSVLPDVAAVSRSLITEMMASGPSGVSGVVLEGIDAATVGKVTSLPANISEGRLPEKDGEVVLGAAIASKIGTSVGQSIRLIAPFIPDGDEEKSRETGGARFFSARVVGIARLGMHEYDSKYAFGALPWVQSLFGQKDRVSTFKIKVKDRRQAAHDADLLSDRFAYPFRAKDSNQLNKNLFYAIQLEKIVIAIILMVIIVVAAFNVVSTLMMVIHDKTREMAILKAMGLRSGQGFRLFCLIGMWIGVVGTASGLGLGLSLDWILSKTRLIGLPADIYYIDFLPVYIDWKEIILIVLSTLLITWMATFYPAIRASTQSPMDGIRYE